jgi:hypothetical protein
MRSPKHRIWVAGVLLLVLPAPSSAAEGECNGFDDLSRDAEVSLGSISKPRVQFIKTSLDDASCPSTAAACRQSAYLVKGDEVILSRSRNGFVCAAFLAPRRRMVLGWLPADAVARRRGNGDVRFEDWVGDWQFDLRAPRYRAQGFTITKSASKPGMLHIEGNANYADDQAAARKGYVNTANIAGEVAATGAVLEFDDGDEDNPVPKERAGDGGSCHVQMRLLGRYLLAKDDWQCGGQNVTFWGIYQRKGARR